MVHRALSTIQNNGVSAFQGELYTGRVGPIVGTLESVHIIEVSAFQGCPQGGVPLYRCALAAQRLPFPCSLTMATMWIRSSNVEVVTSIESFSIA